MSLFHLSQITQEQCTISFNIPVPKSTGQPDIVAAMDHFIQTLSQLQGDDYHETTIESIMVVFVDRHRDDDKKLFRRDLLLMLCFIK